MIKTLTTEQVEAQLENHEFANLSRSELIELVIRQTMVAHELREVFYQFGSGLKIGIFRKLIGVFVEQTEQLTETKFAELAEEIRLQQADLEQAFQAINFLTDTLREALPENLDYAVSYRPTSGIEQNWLTKPGKWWLKVSETDPVV
jgi:hypothetical protein